MLGYFVAIMLIASFPLIEYLWKRNKRHPDVWGKRRLTLYLFFIAFAYGPLGLLMVTDWSYVPKPLIPR